MSLRIVFRRAARREFEDAAVWYNRRRAGLGAMFRSAVDQALVAASEAPNRFPQMNPYVRRVIVRKSPYSIFYVTEFERLVILAVFHSRRDPQVWRSRT